jgi:pyruvate dehydrogenase E1 component
MSKQPIEDDIDPIETEEWLAALKSVIANEGPERAQYLMAQLVTAMGGGWPDQL